MSEISDAALHDPAGQRDFNDGASENMFAQNRGNGGTGQTLRDMLDLRGQAAGKLRSLVDDSKNQVTGSLDGVVEAAREIAAKLGDGSYGPIGGYATAAADALEDWAQSVKDKSVDELIDDGRDFVRQQPQIAVGVAVVVGFALSRLLKAGSGR